MRRWLPLLLLVASCSKTLNMDNAKAFVSKNLEDQTGAKPETICPDKVEAKAGGKFQCTAKFAGGAEATVVIVQNDDKGNVTIESIRGILVVKALEAQIAEGVGKQTSAKIEVSCGERVRPATAGATFQCDAKDANGQTAKVNVTVKDADGNVSWEVVRS